MFKKITTIATALATLSLTGCVAFTPMGFDKPKSEPRPQTTESSYALNVTKAIKTSANCFGCEDTALWPNEADYFDKVGFVPREVAAKLMKAYDKAQEEYVRNYFKWERAGSNPADKPVRPISPLAVSRNVSNISNVSSGVNPYLIADSLDGRWTNTGAALGLGIALDLGTSLLTAKDDDNEDYPPVNQLKATLVLPEEDQIRFHHFDSEDLTDAEKTVLNVGAFAAQRFVKLLTKSAVDMGYTPIGDVQIEFTKDSSNKPSWNHVWQPLENDIAGCPKVKEGMDREDVCRVEWAPYRITLVRNQYTWRLEHTVVPEILGGNGKRKAWIAHFGYDHFHPVPLMVSEAKNEPSSVFDGKRDLQFAMGLQKHLGPGEFVYVPMYFVDEAWSSQRVLDKNGIHYFSVIVNR